MKKKIIVTEAQARVILKYVNENASFDRILGRIVKDLDLNYEPAMGTHEIGNEFFHAAMISKKVDGKDIKPVALMDYLKHKYQGVNEDFLKQVLTDWFHGRLKEGGKLSKNVQP